MRAPAGAAEKKRLELELHEIKSSLAWLSIIKYRGLRDWLLPPGRDGAIAYGIIKAVLNRIEYRLRTQDLI